LIGFLRSIKVIKAASMTGFNMHKILLSTLFSLFVIVMSSNDIQATPCEGFEVESVQLEDDAHGNLSLTVEISSEYANQTFLIDVELDPTSNLIVVSDNLDVTTDLDGFFTLELDVDYIDLSIGLPDELELSGIIYIGNIGDELFCELAFENIPVINLISPIDEVPVYETNALCLDILTSAWIDDNAVLNLSFVGNGDVQTIDANTYLFQFPEGFQDYFMGNANVDVSSQSNTELEMQLASLNLNAFDENQTINFMVSLNINEDLFCEIPISVQYFQGAITGTIINTDDVFEPNRIIPNPAKDQATIDLSALPSTESQITVYNLTGQIILDIVSDSDYETIDISDVAPGIYVLTVTNDSKLMTNKLMIE